MPEYSRSRLQDWIKAGRVTIGGKAAKPSYLLRGTEEIEVEAAALTPLRAVAEDIPLDILYEDDSVIAVNKASGVVVHAGAGHREGTLVNALLHHFGALSTVGGELRPGIVHRLDQYTSGVILVARTDAGHRKLAEQFSERTVVKTYLALVHGDMPREIGRVTTPIARDPVRRTRMTAKLPTGRTALTMWRVRERLAGYTLLEVKIGTGRTHQIRVHLSSIGHPVAGDKLYGAPAGGHGRYFLHAWSISFESPATGERVMVTAELPEDLEAWLSELQ